MSHGRRLVLLILVSFFLSLHLFTPASRSQGTNHSVLLNGTSAYVDVPYNGNLNITGALTLEAWVKTSSTSYQHVLSADTLQHAARLRHDADCWGV